MNKKVIMGFPEEVIKEIQYYVYRLIDPRNGETFYVGKGKGNRVFEHIKGVLKSDDLADDVDNKISRIRAILNAGLEVIHVIHRHGLDEATALEVEAALIDAYPGITNIAGGYGSSERGAMTVNDIIKQYIVEEVKLEHNVVMININRSIKDVDIYDAVRYAWKVNVERAKRADFILAVEKGIIVGVFVAEEWKKANRHNFPEFQCASGRWGFIGKEADDEVQGLYLGKRIPSEYRKKGAAFPLKYNFD